MRYPFFKMKSESSNSMAKISEPLTVRGSISSRWGQGRHHRATLLRGRSCRYRFEVVVNGALADVAAAQAVGHSHKLFALPYDAVSSKTACIVHEAVQLLVRMVLGVEPAVQRFAS